MTDHRPNGGVTPYLSVDGAQKPSISTRQPSGPLSARPCRAKMASY
jgi:hypothetical protein